MEISIHIECHRARRHPETRLVLSTIYYKNLKIEGLIMAAQLNAHELLVGTLGLVNHATGEAITATFTNVSVSSSDTATFTAALDGSGLVDVTGVAVGTGTLSISADATYVDPASSATVTFTKLLVVAVTVSPSATATDLVIAFGKPTPVTP